MDFTILETTGVNQKEFGYLVGVSRVSVNYWVSGRSKPSKHVTPQCKRYLAYLTVAHRMKLLPGQIPPMRKGNVEFRRAYIRDKLAVAAEKIAELKASKK